MRRSIESWIQNQREIFGNIRVIKGVPEPYFLAIDFFTVSSEFFLAAREIIILIRNDYLSQTFNTLKICRKYRHNENIREISGKAERYI